MGESISARVDRPCRSAMSVIVVAGLVRGLIFDSTTHIQTDAHFFYLPSHSLSE